MSFSADAGLRNQLVEVLLVLPAVFGTRAHIPIVCHGQEIKPLPKVMAPTSIFSNEYQMWVVNYSQI